MAHSQRSELAGQPIMPYYEASMRAMIVRRRPDVFARCTITQQSRFVMFGASPSEGIDDAAAIRSFMTHGRDPTPVVADGFLLQNLPRVNFQDHAVRVPWLYAPYEGQRGDFLTYPAQQGYDVELLRKGEFGDHTTTEGTRFLQSWLFFGLICEMFGSVSYLDWVDLDEAILKSPLLPHHMHALSAALQADRSPETFSRCATVLRLTMTVAEAFDNKSTEPSGILWSILTFGQMISNIVLRVYDVNEANIEQWSDGALLDARIAARHWCPCLVNRLKTTLTMDSLYYLTMLDWDAPEQVYAPPSRRDHSSCTLHNCLADQVDYDSYATAHTTAGCNCAYIGLDAIQDLYDILDTKTIPNITYASGKLRIEPTTGDYVAISHVWADGLGNPHDNSLPLCQLERISQYLVELTGKPGQPFWIDTICVPRDTNHRWKALDLMNQTYARAASVLVLDSTLVKADTQGVVDRELDENDLVEAETWRMGLGLELMTRIVCSPWTTRVWTLPEGQLSGLLYFRFLDRAIELSDLYASLRMWPWAGTSLPHDLRRFLTRLRPRLRTQEAPGFPDLPAEDPDMRLWPTGSPADRFIAMLQALEWRDTSRRVDEFLCLSIQLNLQVSEIMARPGEQKLAELLRQVRDLPVDMIFSRGPRIARQGFRWAPTSLLDIRKNFSMVPAAKPDVLMGVQTADGLCFEMECIQLQFGELPATTRLFFAVGLGSPQYYCLLVDCGDPIDLPVWQTLGEISSKSSVWLLMGREGFHGPAADERPARVCLLAEETDEEVGERVRVQPLLTVVMISMPPTHARPRTMPGGGRVRMWAGEHFESRKFCVS